jgi:hypothetical protein
VPRRLLRAAGLAGLLSTGAGLAACGGGSSTNGVEKKAPSAIVSASKQAADTAASVHVSGTIASSTGAPTTFDINLVKGKGARGTLSDNGVSFELIRIGGSIYLKGSPDFYRRFGGAAATLLKGRWLTGKTIAGSLASIGPITDLPGFVDNALTQPANTILSKTATTTVAGQKVVQVKDASGGTLSVAVTGKPYPTQIAKGGTSGGAIRFDHWDGVFPLAAPTDPVDIDRLQGAGK